MTDRRGRRSDAGNGAVAARTAGRFRFLVTLTVAVVGLALSPAMGALAAVPTANPDAQVGKQVATYCGNGISAINVELPAGFNPLTATDAQLVANGLPERPAGGADLVTWERYVTGKVKRQPATCDLRQSAAAQAQAPAVQAGPAAPAAASHASPNWAGWVLGGHTYTDAYASWRVPNVVRHPARFTAFSSSWVGIDAGNSKGTPLVQAGSEADYYVGQPPGYYIWWQVVPQLGHQETVALARANDLISVHVHLTHDDAVMTVHDETTGGGGMYSYTTGTFNPGRQAEWILERTDELGGNGHYLPPLASATTTFTGAEVSGSGVSKRGIGAIPDRSKDVMYTCTRPYVKLANPGAISGNTKFTDYWDAFGHQDKPGCTPHE